MRVLLLSVLFVSVIALHPQTPEHPVVNKGAASNGKQAASSQDQNPLSPTNARIVGSPSAEQHPAKEERNEDKSNSGIYKVDVVTPAPKPQDTPLFPVYVWITGIGVLVNALIWLAIFHQTKTNEKQLSELAKAANAADASVKAAQETVETMRKSARLDQRAWMSINEVKIDGLHIGGVRAKVRITIGNTGRTPAKRAAIALDIVPKESGKEPVFQFLDPTGSSVVIFPNGIYSNFCVYNFTDQTLKRIMDGEIVIWVNGKVIYQDIFGRGHWIKFCYFMTPVDQMFHAHTQYNEIDEDGES